jgi:hypothetical protein
MSNQWRTSERSLFPFEFSDKRSEPRWPASGPIFLQPVDPAVPEGTAPFALGSLVDTSEHGFRARHMMPNLNPGQQVRYRHSGGSGLARVVWNRILGSKVESGFFLVD